MSGQNERVCPRCGTARSPSRWCSGCGLNLDLAGELPTSEEYSAAQREKQWLARQPEREASGAAAERRPHDGLSVANDQQGAQTDQSAGRQHETTRTPVLPRGDARPHKRRRRSVAAATVVVLAGAAAALALVLTSGRHPTTSTPSIRRSSGPTPTAQSSSPSSPPATTGRQSATSKTSPGAPSATLLTLGRANVFSEGEGFGAVQPRVVYFGGDTTTYFHRIRWQGWGKQQSVGYGRGICPVATKPTSEAPPCEVALHASSLGACNGHLAYRQLQVYYNYRHWVVGSPRLAICGKQLS